MNRLHSIQKDADEIIRPHQKLTSESSQRGLGFSIPSDTQETVFLYPLVQKFLPQPGRRPSIGRYRFSWKEMRIFQSCQILGLWRKPWKVCSGMQSKQPLLRKDPNWAEADPTEHFSQGSRRGDWYHGREPDISLRWTFYHPGNRFILFPQALRLRCRRKRVLISFA